MLKSVDMSKSYKLDTLLHSRDDIGFMLKEMMNSVTEKIDADKATVQIFDDEKKTLSLIDTIGFDHDTTNRFQIVKEDDITTCAAALKEHKQIFVDDLNKSPKFSEFNKVLAPLGLNTVISTPLIDYNGHLLGILTLYWNKTHHLTDDKLYTLNLYTQQAVQQLENNKAERALAESEKKYRTLFESIDEGFVIIKLIFDNQQNPVDYQFIEANPSFEKQTGLHSVEGKFAHEIIQNHKNGWLNKYGKVALSGKPVRFEEYSEALKRWYRVHAFRLGQAEERNVAVIFNDVSDQRRADRKREKLLRETKNEREQLISIFNHAPSYMCILRGPDHVFERINDLFKELIGDYNVIDKPARDVFPEFQGNGFFKLLDRIYEMDEPYFGIEKKITLKNLPGRPAAERYIDIVCQPLHDSTGSVSGIFVQGVDRTKQTTARIELQKMNETLEKRVEERTETLLVYQDHLRLLAARLSKTEEQERQRLATELHNNLGQLLTLCKMNIDQLQKKEMTESEDTDLSELAGLMDEAIIHTRQLMFDLKPPPAYKNESFWTAIKWISSKMKKQGLEVQLEEDPNLKPYNEDVQTFLLQSVQELLLNVIKHAKADKARLVITENNDQIQILVSDHGMGFNIEETELVPYRESGFGLFNIKERMNLLGGSFQISSQPGIGTEVLLSVPQKPGNKSAMGDGEHKKTSERDELLENNEPNKKINVLLADDHRMMRKGLRRLIEEEADMTVIAEASDGKEAVKLSIDLQPDIVVMDINMPGMDGIEATRQITSNGQAIRIIGLSFHKEEDVAKSMMDAGASVYLTKSDVFETLCETIRNEAGNRKK